MIRLLLAENMHLVRSALVALLSKEDDLEVVAETGQGGEIVALARESRPDVALIDIHLPCVDGLTAASELHERMPECRTVILTGRGTPAALRRALGAKASGFMVKDASAQQFVDCVRRVARGERVIDPELALAALNAPENPLTSRELDVLQVAAEGSTVTEIADRLYLSPGTVRNYLCRILPKVGARTRVEAIRISLEHGWLWPETGGDLARVRYPSLTGRSAAGGAADPR
ncbi:response regulator transcription factor [Microtetraspora niveoalba]|uniref:response regulator transcription factor n=1 Tax=Microtetraspora niveoalba TaxID=46175 RepID=UPI0008321578|nr:response regulator transcription factor [Microtetraspora niveoalba]